MAKRGGLKYVKVFIEKIIAIITYTNNRNNFSFSSHAPNA